jgi:hypothetical protein
MLPEYFFRASYARRGHQGVEWIGAILRQNAHCERLAGVLKLPLHPDQKQSSPIAAVDRRPLQIQNLRRRIPQARHGDGQEAFSIDLKSRHGSPDLAREIAFKKIAARVEGTAMASEKLGLA